MGRTLFIFPGQSRTDRLPGATSGDVPHEFFYGYLALRDAGFDVAIADSRRDPDDLLGRALVRYEIRRNSFVNLGYSLQRVRALNTALESANLALSFTDGFSLSLGLYGHRLTNRPRLAGGFHGLADMPDQVHPYFRQSTHRIIQRAVAGLDHLFFSGEPDRLESIKRFNLPTEKTSLYRFGIDTNFWQPASNVAEEDLVFSVGSDPKRDFATLVAAPTNAPVRILTRLALPPANRAGVEFVRGSYHGSPITDVVLRDMYQAAAIICVPLRDVWQPTGCSVTLQAMACGRPVVLSDYRGLWDRHVFADGHNCVLVPPGDPAALAAAIDRLRADPELRQRIGTAARETATTHFALDRMNQDIIALAERFGARPTAAANHMTAIAS